MSLVQIVLSDGSHQWFLDGKLLGIHAANIVACGKFSYTDNGKIVGHSLALNHDSEVEVDNISIADRCMMHLMALITSMFKLLLFVLMVITAGCGWTFCWKFFLRILFNLVSLGLNDI